MRRLLTLCAAGAALWAPATAQNVADGSRLQADASVSVPSIAPPTPALQSAFAREGHWRSFSEAHGGWAAVFNEFTGTPIRAFGPAVKVPGYGRVTAANVKDAAWAFIAEHGAALRAEADALRLSGAVEANGRFYVSFVQQHEGLDVLESDVELRIFPNGNVAAFGSTIYDIALDVTPQVSEAAAVASAVAGTGFVAGQSRAEVRRLAVLPVRHKTAAEGAFVRSHLVYEVEVVVDPAHEVYLAWVDAHTGAIVRRDLTVYNHAGHDHGAGHGEPAAGGTTGVISGPIRPLDPYAPEESRPFLDTYITIDGEEYTTDEEGAYEALAGGTVPYSAHLTGPWVNTVNLNGANAEASGDTDGSGTFDLVWDDENSTPGERNMFYHVNLLHAFLKDFDPGFIGLDRQVRAQVNNTTGTCNASWSSAFIMNFFNEGGGCPNMATVSGVVYHEYGHGVNQTVYDQADDGVINNSSRMNNRAINEGMADVQSTMFINDSRVGIGFSGPGTVLRDADNNFIYPRDYSGQLNPVTSGTYRDGEILSGAFWTLNELAGLEVMRHTSHFAKYGRPDDAQTTYNVYAEFFLEALIADDDDGDLSNGTPNSDAIYEAFDSKGIGTQLYVEATFFHLPFGDTPITDQDYPVMFQVQAIGQTDLSIVYSTDNFETTQTVTPELVSGITYRGHIPAQDPGTVVRYYIEVSLGGGATVYTFPENAPEKHHVFLVGFERVEIDDLEADTGWTASNDDATQGGWELGDPDLVDIQGTIFQPGDDHTFSGTDAWITGLAAASNPALGSILGVATVTSPVFDLSDYRRPVIRWYQWFFGRGTGVDDFVVEVSNDGGDTWVVVSSDAENTDGWARRQFYVPDFVTPTANVRVRFTAQDVSPRAIVEAGIDDVELLDAPGAPVATEGGVPAAFAFTGAFPNPASQAAALAFELPQPTDVAVTVYDVLGRAVAAAAAPFAEGRHTMDLDVSRLPAGAYVVRLEAGAHAATHKITVLR